MTLLPRVSKSGSHFVMSSSSVSFPWSRSCRIAAAVNCLVSDPIWNVVSTVAGESLSTTALPTARFSRTPAPAMESSRCTRPPPDCAAAIEAPIQTDANSP